MFRKVILPLLIVFAFVLPACGGGGSGGQADLVPVKASGNPTFCEKQDNTLLVYVQNIGTADASSAEVKVEFFLGPGYSKTVGGITVTGILKAGETLNSPIAVPIPSDCFNPDCNFRLTVDPSGVVKESNKTNNTVEDACIG
ncbi:MAG: hypothetical protein HY258_03955 [Chloroflexi bacterium]|nr:hypothetical protein [Chloroflexota bacterium]